jgi:hypothetical protein
MMESFIRCELHIRESIYNDGLKQYGYYGILPADADDGLEWEWPQRRG